MPFRLVYPLRGNLRAVDWVALEYEKYGARACHDYEQLKVKGMRMCCDDKMGKYEKVERTSRSESSAMYIDARTTPTDSKQAQSSFICRPTAALKAKRRYF